MVFVGVKLVEPEKPASGYGYRTFASSADAEDGTRTGTGANWMSGVDTDWDDDDISSLF